MQDTPQSKLCFLQAIQLRVDGGTVRFDALVGLKIIDSLIISLDYSSLVLYIQQLVAGFCFLGKSFIAAFWWLVVVFCVLYHSYRRRFDSTVGCLADSTTATEGDDDDGEKKSNSDEAGDGNELDGR